MPGFINRHWRLLAIISVFLALIILTIFITPQGIVDYVGVDNTYLVAFLMAVFGGLSTITGTSFFLSVAVFSKGGADPLLLGLFGGLGIFISDSIFFLIARYGVEVLNKKAKPVSLWLIAKMNKFSLRTILTGVYVYIAFSPLPNDILMVALAFTNISYRRLAPVLLVGSITVVLLVAYFGEVIFWWL